MSTPIIKGTSISGDSGPESSCVPPPPGHIDLSQIEYHPWPACFVAAVSKLLDNAGIPNVLWGDLLHWWRGCRHIPQICGLVVPSDQFDTAVTVIEDAGLPSCPCETSFHFSDPKKGYWLPVHFRVTLPPIFEQTLFLCPNKRLFELLPLYPSHRNPLNLSFDQYIVDIYNSFHPVEIAAGSSASTNVVADSPTMISRPPNVHSLKVMTTSSLIKTLIILRAFSPPDNQCGVEHPFLAILFLLCADTSDQGPHVFGSQSVQRLWDELYTVKGMENPHRPDLWDGVRNEWKNKLGLELPVSK